MFKASLNAREPRKLVIGTLDNPVTDMAGDDFLRIWRFTECILSIKLDDALLRLPWLRLGDRFGECVGV